MKNEQDEATFEDALSKNISKAMETSQASGYSQALTDFMNVIQERGLESHDKVNVYEIANILGELIVKNAKKLASDVERV